MWRFWKWEHSSFEGCFGSQKLEMEAQGLTEVSGASKGPEGSEGPGFWDYRMRVI